MIFQVPQFIDIEDKIFGPFTFKQFLYLAGGAGFTVVMFKLLPMILALIVSSPVVVLALALSFLKINNKSFVFILEAFLKYHLGGKLYLWKKDPKRASPERKSLESTGQEIPSLVPSLTGSRLKDLSCSLEVLNNTK